MGKMIIVILIIIIFFNVTGFFGNSEKENLEIRQKASNITSNCNYLSEGDKIYSMSYLEVVLMHDKFNSYNLGEEQGADLDTAIIYTNLSNYITEVKKNPERLFYTVKNDYLNKWENIKKSINGC
jgi:uncharacterized protein YpmB